MERDYHTKGVELIRTKLGIINATSENFNVTAAQMIEDKDFQETVGMEGGVFCLPPWELDIPF